MRTPAERSGKLPAGRSETGGNDLDRKTGKTVFPGLDGTALKLLALASMVIDHVGYMLYPGARWLRACGRLAMPVFAFCVAEGLAHTRDRGRYLLRMGAVGLISEIPYDLMTKGKVPDLGHQNILLTFFAAILALILYEAIRTRVKGWPGILPGLAVLAAAACVSRPLKLDYNYTAVGLVYLFYLLRDTHPALRTGVAMAWYGWLRRTWVGPWGLLAFPLLLLYNGKRGRGLKWLFYAAFPAHMLLIRLIGILR